MENLYSLLEERGFIDQVTSLELKKALIHPLKLYLGFDPTAKSLHVGHLVGVMALAWFQKFGHEVFISNLASAFLCMQLAAKTLGLGSQWVSAAGSFMEDDLKELLNIPKGVKIYDMMAVGYPAYQLGPRSPRKIEEMTHYDQYDRTKLRSDQEIKEFIKNLRKER